MSLGLATKGRLVNQSKSYATLGYIYVPTGGAIFTGATTQLDALIKRLDVKVLNYLDALIQKSGSQYVDIDSVLQDVFYESLDIDSILKRLSNLTNSDIDAVLKNLDVQTIVQLDSMLMRYGTEYASLDSILVELVERIYTNIDALIVKQQSIYNLIDAILASAYKYGVLRFGSRDVEILESTGRILTFMGGSVDSDISISKEIQETVKGEDILRLKQSRGDKNISVSKEIHEVTRGENILKFKSSKKHKFPDS